MKNYVLKMVGLLLVVISGLTIYQNKKIRYNNWVTNTVLTTEINYDNIKIYEDLTFRELKDNINKQLNSTLDGYGETIILEALDANVDPVVATSIILVETGCKYNCSHLVKDCHNVGGMKGHGCGSYARYDTLDEGIKAFISNLSKNYYQKGLTTPQTINKKYAQNPNWYQNVNYYVNLIKN